MVENRVSSNQFEGNPSLGFGVGTFGIWKKPTASEEKSRRQYQRKVRQEYLQKLPSRLSKLRQSLDKANKILVSKKLSQESKVERIIEIMQGTGEFPEDD